MANPTDVVIDPASGTDDPGTLGTLGDPFLTLQYAYDTIGPDATHGTVYHVKNGTTDSTGNTSLTMANATPAAPVWIQGFTSALFDGGRGHVDTGTADVFSAPYNYIHVQDMEITSSSTNGLEIKNYGSCINTVVNGNLTVAGNQADVHRTTVEGKVNITGSYSEFSYGKVTADSGTAIRLGNNTSRATFNRVICETGCDCGIKLTAHNTKAYNNSLYASGTVATGIECDDASYTVIAARNVLEGFTTALKTASNTNGASFFSNSSYGHTTLEDFQADPVYQTSTYGNESLGSSPFTDAPGGDLTPLNVGGVLEDMGDGSILARGALSPAIGGGGGNLIVVED